MRGSEALRGAHKAVFSTAILLYRLTGVPAAHHRKKNLTTARSSAHERILAARDQEHVGHYKQSQHNEKGQDHSRQEKCDN